MRRLLAILLLASLPAAAAIEPDDFSSDAEARRYQKLLEEIRCMVCDNQSLADSGAGLAADLRQAVRRLLAEGATDAEVRAFLQERYGAYILYRPPLRASTVALWLGPPLLLLAVAAIVWTVLRRQRGGDAG
ncbi:MAG: cytochrome c-type biogenesis protein CcmH [Betaproteobacteria bacterium AqS2]|uniref:Cytochrome c-type biogenesis protein n=1 Tax=Candidatus Amphirhobacter heronislandensis TaxID=1732024 RepID=A0A930UHB5_9GAMM|nr:cytochrome c-type biogenesis protein CcmH [Betaproteobacteria bacterium AqS2]